MGSSRFADLIHRPANKCALSHQKPRSAIIAIVTAAGSCSVRLFGRAQKSCWPNIWGKISTSGEHQVLPGPLRTRRRQTKALVPLDPWKISSPRTTAPEREPALSWPSSGLCWAARPVSLACAWQARPCGPLGHTSKAAEPLPAQSKGREQWRGTRVETPHSSDSFCSPSDIPGREFMPGQVEPIWVCKENRDFWLCWLLWLCGTLR